MHWIYFFTWRNITIIFLNTNVIGIQKVSKGKQKLYLTLICSNDISYRDDNIY